MRNWVCAFYVLNREERREGEKRENSLKSRIAPSLLLCYTDMVCMSGKALEVREMSEL